jgi:hypothetical protein
VTVNEWLTSPERPGYRYLATRAPALTALVGVFIAVPLIVFLLNPFQPLLEHHAFRQTQTAVTSYWLAHGGELLSYLTPVLGYPWTVPMEFPLYQALVAKAATLSGLPLDFTGRLASLVFFYATLIPIAAVLKRYGPATVAIACTLFVTSPILVFFSRTFLMESLATLLALLALCAYIAYLRHSRSAYLAAFVVFGTLGGLQKITTFAPVLAVCGLDYLIHNYRFLFRGSDRLRALGVLCALGATAVLAGIWVLYTDAVKESGLISSFMTSEGLRLWNFGSLSLRLHPEYWIKVFALRIGVLGGFSIAAVLLGLAFWRKAAVFNREATLFLSAGLIGPLVFANLHFVHDYYQLGSLAFFVCGLAIVVSAYCEGLLTASRARFALLVAVLAAVNLSIFGLKYAPKLYQTPHVAAVAYDVADYLKHRQSPEEVALIVGMDWDSTIPYYAERFALMIPDSILVPAWSEARARVVRDPAAYTGGRTIGAVVYCRFDASDAGSEAEMNALLERVDGDRVDISECAVKVRSGSRVAWSPRPDAAP